MKASVAALNIYPVKSCRGIALTCARLTERGLDHDRQWMIVDRDGDPALFVTQREIPKLALIQPALTAHDLELAAPGMPRLSVPLNIVGPTCDAIVWSSTVSAIDQGPSAAAWLSGYLAMDVRLVRFDPAQRRLCNPAFAGDSGAHTGFADGYPLLVIGSASLTELNRRLAEKGSLELPMNRFRPNVVLDGLEAHDEDHLREIAIGDAVLRMVKPCVRCQITTTDQATAEVGAEPLRTLAGYRNDARLGGVTFGMNAIAVRGVGAMRSVGDKTTLDWAF